MTARIDLRPCPNGGLMGLEENGDWEDIVAWMPLPEPYKEANDE